MSRILTGKAYYPWQTRWANPFQTDQADAHYRLPGMELWMEWLWEHALNDFGVGSEIDEQPSLDHAANDGYSHLGLFGRPRFWNAQEPAAPAIKTGTEVGMEVGAQESRQRMGKAAEDNRASSGISTPLRSCKRQPDQMCSHA